jgi:hypothetical protein
MVQQLISAGNSGANVIVNVLLNIFTRNGKIIYGTTGKMDKIVFGTIGMMYKIICGTHGIRIFKNWQCLQLAIGYFYVHFDRLIRCYVHLRICVQICK